MNIALRPDLSRALAYSPHAGTRTGATFLHKLILVSLTACAMLLPIDGGFPQVSVEIAYITLATLLSLICITALSAQSFGRVWSLGIRKKFAVGQIGFALVMLLSTLLDANINSALNLWWRYVCIWVINYLILSYIFERGGRPFFVKVVAIVAACAAAVGILQGLFHVVLAPYQAWTVNFEDSGASTGFRSFGTSGNPIPYSVLVLGAFPFLLELRSVKLKWSIIGSIVLAALLTISRTSLLVLAVFGLGWALIHRKNTTLLIGTSLALSVGLAAVIYLGSAANSNDSVANIWMQRLGLVQGIYSASAGQNVEQRQNGVTLAVNSVFQGSAAQMLFGNGLSSVTHIGEELSSGSTTIDNQYLSILYEQGIVGIGVYVVVFLALLVRTRDRAKWDMHWYSIVALLSTGVCFAFVGYQCNFLFVASIASITMRHPHDVVFPGSDATSQDSDKSKRKLSSRKKLGGLLASIGT